MTETRKTVKVDFFTTSVFGVPLHKLDLVTTHADALTALAQCIEASDDYPAIEFFLRAAESYESTYG